MIDIKKVLYTIPTAWIVLSILAGCGTTGVTPAAIIPATTPTSELSTPTAEAQQEWILYERQADGFMIGLPSTWKQIDLDAGQDGNLSPEIKSQIQKMKELGGNFYAYDPRPDLASIGIIPGIFIVRKNLGRLESVESYASSLVRQLQETPEVDQPVTRLHVSLAKGPAEQIEYRTRQTTITGQDVSLSFTHYLITDGKNIYTLSLFALAEEAEKYAPIFGHIGYNFRSVNPQLDTSRIEPTPAPTHTPLPTSVASTALTEDAYLQADLSLKFIGKSRITW